MNAFVRSEPTLVIRQTVLTGRVRGVPLFAEGREGTVGPDGLLYYSRTAADGARVTVSGQAIPQDLHDQRHAIRLWR
jgi:hypothetical protein